jgi:serine protease Do
MTVDGYSRSISLRCIRIDAAVNSGNSGGGLFNDKGELIGIVNAKLSDTSVDNIGYAIPSNVAKAVADNIIHYCDGTDKENVYRCMLRVGVGATAAYTKYDTETGKIYKFERVVISSIEEGSPVTDLLVEKDVINSITIDGVKHDVTRTFHVIDSMLNARVGSTVVINVTRAGETFDVTIPITEEMLTAY